MVLVSRLEGRSSLRIVERGKFWRGNVNEVGLATMGGERSTFAGHHRGTGLSIVEEFWRVQLRCGDPK